jgi:competence protein ComEC
LAVAGWLADLPAAVAPAGAYNDAWTIATYAVLLAMAPLAVRLLRGIDAARPAQSRPFAWPTAAGRAMLAAPVLAIAATAGWLASDTNPPRLEVTMLDVGQGDAILIETPGGSDVLIDGGPGGAVLRGLGRERPWHDRSIDLVVLTHGQADHGTGLFDVFERYDVDRTLTAVHDDTPLADDVRATALDEGADVIAAHSDRTFDLGDGVRLEVLWPTANPSHDASSNNGGIVLRLSWRDVSFLLTADIEAETEAALVASGAELRTTVLKVAHHGSKTSTTAAFLDAVAPSIAVISSGAGNPHGHPAPEVIERLEGVRTYNTASDGDVHLKTDGERLWIDE